MSTSRTTAARPLELSSLPLSKSHESLGTHILATPLPITFSHANFAYPSRPTQPILQDFNLKVSAGSCIAIVGASGSGKSTIANLLLGLYVPTNSAPGEASQTPPLMFAGVSIT